MSDYLRFPLYISRKYAHVREYLRTLPNASEYICNLILADMSRDPAERIKAALKADMIRLEKSE